LNVDENVKLIRLQCNHNQLTSLNVGKNAALTHLYCHNNELTSLDVRQNTLLEELRCYYNQLTALNVDKNVKLTRLQCNNNKLTALNVDKNVKLIQLQCHINQLDVLNTTQNTFLTELACHTNRLTTLDISHNTALKNLYCHANQLGLLDVSKNTALKELHCYNNQLTELDISKNIALAGLRCDNNQLSELDVSKNALLKNLECNNNRLTTLDISHNTALEKLRCYTNQLGTLDVSKNTALKELHCQENQLTPTLDVSKNTNLILFYFHKNQLTALDLSQNDKLIAFSRDQRDDPQTCPVALLSDYDSGSGKYTFNLADVYAIGADVLTRVVAVKQANNVALPATASYDSSTGILRIDPAKKLSSIRYSYWLRCPNNSAETMGVIVNLTYSPVAASGVSLDQSTLTLDAGGAPGTLIATVAPAEATNRDIAWTSDNPSVATVANGVVTPVAAGTANITVTTADGGFTAVCVVTVKPALALTFTGSPSYDIPASTTGTAIADIDVSGGVSGGTLPYTFSAAGLPAGLAVNPATGVISGVPAAAGAAVTATITVTDGVNAAQSITISYGAISAGGGSGGGDEGTADGARPYDRKADRPVYPENASRDERTYIDTMFGRKSSNLTEYLNIPYKELPFAIINYELPYIEGFEDGTFRGDTPLTRAQMVAIFARILKLPEADKGNLHYTDEGLDTHWARSYLEKMETTGILNGYPDGEFKLDRPVTRAEFAKTVAAFWEKEGYKADAAPAGFKDTVGHWAEKHISQMYNTGLMSGYEDNSFRPDRHITRSEAVVVINKLINRAPVFQNIATFTDLPKGTWDFAIVEAAAAEQRGKIWNTGKIK
jgi:hypothetical protein